MNDLSLDEVMAQRFALVEQKAILAGRHKAEMEPIDETIKLCETVIKDHMNTNGLQQAKTEQGMAFFVSKDSVKSDDWEQFMAWMKANDAYYMLTQAVSKVAVKEYIDANNATPPGLQYSSYRDLSWRKGKG